MQWPAAGRYEAALPAAEVGTGLVEDPLPHGHDEPRFLGQGDEVRGWDQAEGRVLPPHEGLDADQLAVRQPNDRLVVEPQGAPFDRLFQGGPPLQAGDGRLVEAGLEEVVGVLAAVLRRVEGEIGLPEHLGRSLGAVVGRRDADAHPDRFCPLINDGDLRQGLVTIFARALR